MPSITNKPIMLSVVMLNVIILSVVAPKIDPEMFAVAFHSRSSRLKRTINVGSTLKSVYL